MLRRGLKRFEEHKSGAFMRVLWLGRVRETKGEGKQENLQ